MFLSVQSIVLPPPLKAIDAPLRTRLLGLPLCSIMFMTASQLKKIAQA
jgi:hypothetical protein